MSLIHALSEDFLNLFNLLITQKILKSYIELFNK